MADQILRRLRRWSLREVGLRTDHREADVGPDPHRDHIFGDLLAPTYARVIALCNDVGQAIVDGDLDFDVRIFRQEFCQLWPEDRVDCMVAGRDPNGTGWLLPKFTQGRKLGLNLLKPRADDLKQAFAGSVGDTLRVVRVRSRTPRRASSSRMVWLSADCETPSFAAAFVKLRSRPTAMKATRSSRFPRCIYGLAHKSMRIIAVSRDRCTL